MIFTIEPVGKDLINVLQATVDRDWKAYWTRPSAVCFNWIRSCILSPRIGRKGFVRWSAKAIRLVMVSNVCPQLFSSRQTKALSYLETNKKKINKYIQNNINNKKRKYIFLATGMKIRYY